VPPAKFGKLVVDPNDPLTVLTEYVNGFTPPVTAPNVREPLLLPQVAAVVLVTIEDGPLVFETVADTE
jgi:hypothetical protein